MKTKASVKYDRLSRRSFITRTSIASSAFLFVPSHVLGLGGAESANEKLNIAAIGCAGQGGSDINNLKSQNIVAL